MFCKHRLAFSRKGHAGLFQNRTGVNFRTRKKFTEPILLLLNIFWYGHLQFHLHITVIHSSLCKVRGGFELSPLMPGTQSEIETITCAHFGNSHF